MTAVAELPMGPAELARTRPVAPYVVLEPGVYDIPEDAYHRDPIPAGSLSVSGAKRLLPRSCPAIYRYEADNGRDEKNVFDIGHAVHKLVLGVGNVLQEITHADYKTKDAREARQAAYDAGKVPLLTHELELANRMADALWDQPHAAREFDADGLPEQSLFWVDKETGVWCRARPDWLLPFRIVDLKTTTSADIESVAHDVQRFGYHQQAAWYLDGAIELDLAEEDAPFRFVFLSKTPPYLASVVELDDEALDVGRARNRRALEIFRDCTESGYWPGHSTDVEIVSLPTWYVRRELEGF